VILRAWHMGDHSRDIRVPLGWRQGDDGSMVEVLRIVLGGLVVVSLVAIVAYVVVFLVVAAWTVFTSSRRDPLADELDRVLAEIVGPQVPVAGPVVLACDPGDKPATQSEQSRLTPFAGRRFS